MNENAKCCSPVPQPHLLEAAAEILCSINSANNVSETINGRLFGFSPQCEETKEVFPDNLEAMLSKAVTGLQELGKRLEAINSRF